MNCIFYYLYETLLPKWGLHKEQASRVLYLRTFQKLVIQKDNIIFINLFCDHLNM